MIQEISESKRLNEEKDEKRSLIIPEKKMSKQSKK